MKPGDICSWAGRELFDTKYMHFNEVMKVKFGGHALIIALDSFEMLGDAGKNRLDMALVLKDDCLGWSPVHWLKEIQ